MSQLLRSLQKQEKHQTQTQTYQQQYHNNKLSENQLLMLLSPSQRKDIAKGKTKKPLISFSELQQLIEQVQDTQNYQHMMQLHMLQDQVKKLREENWILKNSQQNTSCIENNECTYIM